MSPHPGGPLTRTVIAIAVGVGVLAAQAVQPLSASALTTGRPVPAARPAAAVPIMKRPTAGPAALPPHAGKPGPWSAASAKPVHRPQRVLSPARQRAEAIAQAAKTDKTASYRVSPATLAFLTKGLGLRLPSRTLFTGRRSGSTVTISLPAPDGIRLGLPAGVSAPSLSRSTLTIDTATGAATLTAAATGKGKAALRVSIPDAGTGAPDGPAGDLTTRVPVLGQTVTLSGPVTYRPGQAASASLSGTLPAADTLQRGVAELAAGARVTLSPAGGLRVAGQAALGAPGRQLTADVSGPVTGTGTWKLAVTAAGPRAPLAGLSLSPAASGTVTSTRGKVRFDVRGRTARPWQAGDGATVSGTVEFSDMLPNGPVVPAPGIGGSVPWVDVTGAVSAAGVAATGTAAVNLATGQGLLTSTGRTAVTVRNRAGRMIHDDAGFRAPLGRTRSGAMTAKLPGGLARWAQHGGGSGVTIVRSGERKAAAASASTGSYTLPSAVYDFITGDLNVPLGSATLTGSLSGGTLTVSGPAPTAPLASLPSWIPAPSYVSTTLSVDESTGTVTVTASATAASGETAALTVTVGSDGSATGTLALTGVPFAGGSAAALTFTLGYSGGTFSASLSGALTSPASFAGGTVTIPSASLTLATGSGLTLTGTADINSGSTSATVAVNGTLTDLSDWSLQVSDANAQVWQPVSGLTITPDFTGSITDTAGTVGFDLAATGSSVATWVSPDGASSVSVTSLEVSDQAPSSTSSCSSTPDGHLWVGLGGTFDYAPASLSVSASGCFDLTGKSATITTTAPGSLTGAFSGTLPFGLSNATLTATIASGGTYSLTGNATVAITSGVSGDPSFPVGVSLSSSGLVAGAVLPDLSKLGLSGSGALYVSTSIQNGFDPATALGLTGQPSSFDLPTGLTVSLGYTLPSSVTSALQQVIPGFPSGTSVQSLASLSTTGFTVDLGLSLGTGAGGLRVFDSGNGTAFYLDGVDIKLALGAQNQVTLSGNGFLALPALVAGGTASTLTVRVSGSFNITSLTLGLTFDAGNWNSALGIQGLDVQDFAGSVGVTLESGIPTPSLSLSADNIVLPASWAEAIGMVPGSEIWFDADLNLTQPLVDFRLYNPSFGQPVLTPLAVDPSLSAAVVNSFTVNSAEFVLAPDGGTTAAGDTIQPGAGVVFDATVDNVPVHVDATVSLSTLSVTADASVGAFTIGPVQTSNTSFHLALSPVQGSFGVSGAVSYGGDSFSASVQFSVGTSMNGAAISLQITGGLPSYFDGGANLTGSVSGDGSGAYVYATGSGWLYAAGQFLGPVSFSFSLPGSLDWSDFSNSITQLASFFVNAQLPWDQLVSALEQFGYDTYDIINALSQIGQYGPQITDALASAFGFSTTYYDIWTYTSAAEYLVLDVSGGSQSPSAPVITWDWNGGYNQDWEFVPSPYSGWYEIMNRGSEQCLTVQYNTSTAGNPLIQYPCGGAYNQLWYMGNVSLDTTYVITSALDGLVIDVSGADPWPGGSLDQWYYNGGNNQQFWLTNSTN